MSAAENMEEKDTVVDTEPQNVETTLAGDEAIAPEDEAARIAAAVNQNALLVCVSVHTLGVRRKVTATRATIDGASVGADGEGEIDSAHISVQKKLLSCEEFDEILRLDRVFYTMMMQRVISTQYRKGTYLLPVKLLDWFEQEYAAYTKARAEAIEQFLAVYEDRVEESRKALGPIFDRSQYPSVERVREAFSVERSYQQPGIPDHLARINLSLFQEQKAQMEREFAKSACEARATLRAGLLQLVKHLAEKLTPSADGKKKRLHETTVEQLRDFLQLFGDRDITGDRDLGEVVDDLRDLMDGVDKDLLKNNEAFAGVIQQGLSASAEVIGSMVREHKRSFDFSYDE
jgi:hypothetical protein